jgi:hypothetical protein
MSDAAAQVARRPLVAAHPVRCAVAAVALLELVVLLIAPGQAPAITHDSLGYLAAARWLAGAGEVSQHVGVYYTFGYGGLLALPYGLGMDGSAVNRLAGALNAGAAVALVVPLCALIVETTGLTRGRAALAATAGAVYAGVSLQVPEAWPEVMLSLGVTVWALLVVRCVRRPSPAHAMGLLLTAVALFALHHRTAPILLVSAIAVAALAAQRRWPLRWTVAGAAVTLLAIGGILAVDHAAQEALHPLGAAQQPLLDLANLPSLRSVVRILLGEVFYVAVGTFGVAAVGMAALVALRRDPARWAALAFLLSFAMTAVMGAAQLAGALDTDRFEARYIPQYVAYGRYLDPFVPVLIALGVAAILGGVHRRVMLPPATVAVAGAALLSFGLPSGDADYVPASLPGLVGLDALADGSWRGIGTAGIMLAAFGGAVVLAIAWRASAAAAAAVAVLALGASTIAGAQGVMRPWHAASDLVYQDLAETMRGFPENRTTAVVLRGSNGRPSLNAEATLHRLQFLSPDRRLRPVGEVADLRRAGASLAFIPQGVRPPGGARKVWSVRDSEIALYELASRPKP